MSICGYCNQEMRSADSCIGGINDDLVAQVLLYPHFKASEDLVGGKLRRCGDCGVAAGGTHHPGCDVERCSECNGQALSGCRHVRGLDGHLCTICGNLPDDCECPEPKPALEAIGNLHDPALARWTGIWPGVLLCRQRGWYCHDLLNGKPASHREIHDAQFENGERRKVQPSIRWHVRCAPDAPYASEDLNRLAMLNERDPLLITTPRIEITEEK